MSPQTPESTTPDHQKMVYFARVFTAIFSDFLENLAENTTLEP